jgi:hypothetical protein
MSGEMGNLVVKVDVKGNVEKGPLMANTELLDAWESSGKANSVSGKANPVTQVSQMCFVTTTFYKNKFFVHIGVHIKMHIKL